MKRSMSKKFYYARLDIHRSGAWIRAAFTKHPDRNERLKICKMIESEFATGYIKLNLLDVKDIAEYITSGVKSAIQINNGNQMIKVIRVGGRLIITCYGGEVSSIVIRNRSIGDFWLLLQEAVVLMSNPFDQM